MQRMILAICQILHDSSKSKMNPLSTTTTTATTLLKMLLKKHSRIHVKSSPLPTSGPSLIFEHFFAPVVFGPHFRIGENFVSFGDILEHFFCFFHVVSIFIGVPFGTLKRLEIKNHYQDSIGSKTLRKRTILTISGPNLCMPF